MQVEFVAIISRYILLWFLLAEKYITKTATRYEKINTVALYFLSWLKSFAGQGMVENNNVRHVLGVFLIEDKVYSYTEKWLKQA
jgi:hypothetical protein